MSYHKSLLLAASAVLCFRAGASVCVTIADGAFSDLGNWSCACDPHSCDTVLVGHHMVADGDVLLSFGRLTIIANGSLRASGSIRFMAGFEGATIHGELAAAAVELNSTDSVVVHGLVTCDTLLAGYTRLANRGAIVAERFFGATWYPGVQAFINAGSLRAARLATARMLWNEGVVEADTATMDWYYGTTGMSFFGRVPYIRTAFVEVGSGFHVTDTLRIFNRLEVNGSLSCGTFVIGGSGSLAQTWLYAGSELVCGSFLNQSNGFLYGPGSLCISGHSENHGVISAPINICDITLAADAPPPYLDVNTGGFLQPIYRCAVGTCATVDIEGPSSTSALSCAPVPAQEEVVLRFPGLAGSILLHDAQGRVAARLQGPFQGEARVRRSCLPDGWYAARMLGLDGGLMGMVRVLFTAP